MFRVRHIGTVPQEDNAVFVATVSVALAASITMTDLSTLRYAKHIRYYSSSAPRPNATLMRQFDKNVVGGVTG